MFSLAEHESTNAYIGLSEALSSNANPQEQSWLLPLHLRNWVVTFIFHMFIRLKSDTKIFLNSFKKKTHFYEIHILVQNITPVYSETFAFHQFDSEKKLKTFFLIF
jgi:hypothetical protein